MFYFAGPLTISNAAHRLIIEHECGGRSYYIRFSQTPEWPGGDSGCTIGIGYDLGYNTREQIARDWAGLGEAKVAALQSVAGLKGQRARIALHKIRWVVVPWETAYAVFQESTLPRFGGLTNGAFPGIARENPHGQGALTSLVFNRGASMEGGGRVEMRAIRADIAAGHPERVPASIRAMRRLWVGKGLDGLLRRRNEEAALFQLGLDSRPASPPGPD